MTTTQTPTTVRTGHHPVGALAAATALAGTELRLIMRHRLTAFTAVGMPVLLGAVLGTAPTVLGPDRVPAVQVLVVLGLAVYCGATTSLTARRQDGYLKRLRSGEIGDATILTALLLPMIALGVGQALALAAVTVVIGAPWPGLGGIALLVTGTVLGAVFLAAAAAATAGMTRNPETAQITTLPLFSVVGVGAFIAVSGAGDLATPFLAVPGVGVAEVIRQGWAPGPGLLPALGASLAWIVVAVLVARARFRWDPRD